MTVYISTLKLFSGARDLCLDIDDAIELVCALTKSSEDEVISLLSRTGVFVITGSEEERAIRNFIIENDGKIPDGELKREVSFRFCVCDREAERLVEKWIGFPGGGINERG